jgi:hypothetical protein
MDAAVFYPLGYPLEITTASTDVLEAARDEWGEFRQLFAAEPVRLRIDVEEGDASIPAHAPVFRAQSNVVRIECGDANSVCCDLAKGEGCGRFTLAAARDHDWLRYHFLEAMAYSMIDAAAFTAVHAGCVALDGKGVLLCGDSGAGKSTLAYACARQGWTLVSDDASHLVRGQNVVVGTPHKLRLREPSKLLFPELQNREARLRPNGKRTIEIRTAGMPGIRTGVQTEVRLIAFLNRRGGPAEVRRFSREEAARHPVEILTAAEGDILEAQTAALRELISVEVIELSYEQPAAAIEQLSRIVHNC